MRTRHEGMAWFEDWYFMKKHHLKMLASNQRNYFNKSRLTSFD